jgi:hypothetical protein
MNVDITSKAALGSAVVVTAALMAGTALAGSTKVATGLVGAGIQTRPGGLVADRLGAYVPTRSVYVLKAAKRARVAARVGGYYDPTRSTYIHGHRKDTL